MGYAYFRKVEIFGKKLNKTQKIEKYLCWKFWCIIFTLEIIMGNCLENLDRLPRIRKMPYCSASNKYTWSLIAHHRASPLHKRSETPHCSTLTSLQG